MTRTPTEIDAFFSAVLAVPAHRTFGLSLVRWQPGEAVLEFVANEASFGPKGEVHGGVLSLLLEPPALFALLPLLPADRYAVTADIHVQFLKAIKPHARVTLIGRVTRLGRQMGFCSASATVGDEAFATAQITKSVVAVAKA